MTFEEFEKATASELREMAKQSFESAKSGSWERMAGSLAQAQFFMAELDRREAHVERLHDKRIARRDFRMELIVIALIGLELIAATWGIVLGVRESKDQSEVAQRQIEMLDKVQKSMMRAGNMMLIK